MNPVWHFVNGVPMTGPIGPTVVLSGDGSATAPSQTFASEPGLGWYRSAAGVLSATRGTERIVSVNGSGFLINGEAGYGLALGADVFVSRGAADVLTTPDRFVSTGPVAGIGYATGAGGTVTQGSGSGKATTAVLNTVTGEVTMNNAALNAGVAVSFTLTNSAIALADMVLVQHVSAGTLGAYVCVAVAAAGSASITVANRSGGNLSEAIVLKYVVIKAANS